MWQSLSHRRSLLSSLALCHAQVCHRWGLAGNHAGMSPRQEVWPGVGAGQLHRSRSLLWQQLRRLLFHQLLHALCLPGESPPATKTFPLSDWAPASPDISTAQQKNELNKGKSPHGTFPSRTLSVTTPPWLLPVLPLSSSGRCSASNPNPSCTAREHSSPLRLDEKTKLACCGLCWG